MLGSALVLIRVLRLLRACPRACFCRFRKRMLFPSWALSFSEGSTRCVQSRVSTWGVNRSRLLTEHPPFPTPSRALGMLQTRQLGFLLYGAFSIMGKKDIKLIVTNITCWGGEAQAATEILNGRLHRVCGKAHTWRGRCRRDSPRHCHLAETWRIKQNCQYYTISVQFSAPKGAVSLDRGANLCLPTWPALHGHQLAYLPVSRS